MAELSLVICTRNRVAQLRRCIDAVFATNEDCPFELIVVDNGSSDATPAFLATLPCRYGHITVKTLSQPRGGLSAGHNTGWRASTGNIVAFTDDDCYVAVDYVAAMKACFDDPAVGVVGGRILLFDLNDFKITIREDAEPETYPPRSHIEAGCIQGANMAFRRDALERIGGFDERIGAGTPYTCGDTVAVASVLWAGMTGRYDPRPTVYHHHGRRHPDEIARLRREYATGRGAYNAIFIADRRSRPVYLKPWLKVIKAQSRVVAGALRRGRIPDLPHAWIEVAAAARFVATELWRHGGRP